MMATEVSCWGVSSGAKLAVVMLLSVSQHKMVPIEMVPIV
jgi:hypothetical protein